MTISIRLLTCVATWCAAMATPILAQPPGTVPEPDRGPARRSMRDVLLIIADDVGVDKIEQYVQYYNGNIRSDDDIAGADSVPCTPVIGALAQSGVTFMNAWVFPTCSPTRAAIYTGTYPFRNGVYDPQYANDFNRAGYDPTTIAEALANAGYESGLFGKWHLGSAGEGPVENGWVRHQGFRGSAIEDYSDWTKVNSGATGDTTELHVTRYSTTEFMENARAWINSRSGNWMATVAFNAAHTVTNFGLGLKYQVPPAGCGCHSVSDPESQSEVYRATVECMDAKIGELLAGIDPPARLENTTIIFLGDNGTEDSYSAHFDGQAKHSLYEGGVNVPIIIADGFAYLRGRQPRPSFGPKPPVVVSGRVVRPGRISQALVQALDLFPTIADIAGADKSCAVDAVSLIPLLNHSASSVRAVSFAQTSPVDWTVRDQRNKLGAFISPTGVVALRLFDLSVDRWEQNDLLADGVDLFERGIVSYLTGLKDSIVAVPDGCPAPPTGFGSNGAVRQADQTIAQGHLGHMAPPAVGVAHDGSRAPVAMLGQNRPNPFSGTSRISFQLRRPETVTLQVLDMHGREVAAPLRGVRRDAGWHEIVFDGRGLATGVYLYRLQADSFTATKRMVAFR